MDDGKRLGRAGRFSYGSLDWGEFEGGKPDCAWSSRPGLPKKLTFSMIFRSVFSSVFWKGSGRVSGAILELKIDEKSIKIRHDFLIDF